MQVVREAGLIFNILAQYLLVSFTILAAALKLYSLSKLAIPVLSGRKSSGVVLSGSATELDVFSSTNVYRSRVNRGGGIGKVGSSIAHGFRGYSRKWSVQVLGMRHFKYKKKTEVAANKKAGTLLPTISTFRLLEHYTFRLTKPSTILSCILRR